MQQDNDIYDKVKNLPSGWWKTSEASLSLIAHFKKYVITLLISYHLPTGPNQKNYTGFLFSYGGILYWITAGHVIEEVQKILGSPEVKIQHMAWLDTHPNPKAGQIKIVNKKLDTLNGNPMGFDFGAVKLSTWEAINVSHNEYDKAFTFEAARNNLSSKPEGYYLIGYPDEWETVQEVGRVGKKVRKIFTGDITCLPLGKIDHKTLAPEQKAKWKNKDSFYGRLIPFKDAIGPASIVGMSGGPVVSIERTAEGIFKYRLCAIQSSWFKDTQTIKAESINDLLRTFFEIN